MLTLFEAGAEVLLIVLLCSSFQALLGFFGMLGGGFGVHNMHVVNTARPMSPDVLMSRPPSTPLVLQRIPF